MVSSAHTVVDCCEEEEEEGAALVNTGLLKLFSSRVHNGCVCPHSGYVCCFIGALYNGRLNMSNMQKIGV